MVEQRYRWDFIGLSTDTKPTPETSPKVVDGSTFYTSDDSKLYVWCTNDCYEKKPIGGGGGTLDNYGTVTYLDNGVEKTVTIANEDDFYELCVGGAGTPIHINGVNLNKNGIKAITIADGVQYLPDSFCLGCNNLETVTLPDTIPYIGANVFGATRITPPLNLTNVKSIGANFFQNSTSFNQPLNMPNVEYIGPNFLTGCSSFNSSITLNDSLKVIDTGFLSYCREFNQPLIIPADLDNIGSSFNPGTGFMRNCNAFTGPLVCNGPVSALIPTDNNTLSTTSSSAAMYTTGVTLTGPYAQAWKNALPDRTSSPYRKLIVGS